MDIEIRYQDHIVKPAHNETILEAFERSGIDVPSSCRVGVCHFCLLKAKEGTIPKRAQEGLDQRLKDTGHFKSCVCIAEESLTCEPAHSADFRADVTIESIEKTAPDVVKVTIRRPPTFHFMAGQFATFRLIDGHARSYSIASRYDEGLTHFDIHVRKIPGGKMSRWFHEEACPNDNIWMEGPKGSCVYREESPDEDILFVGTGTGMAPLYAVCDEALSKQHRGSITVLQGALSEERLYLDDNFRVFSVRNPNFKYHSCVLHGPNNADITVGDLREIALEHIRRKDKRIRVYLCGDPGLVRHLKKHFFLAGVSLKNIHADPFIGTDHL